MSHPKISCLVVTLLSGSGKPVTDRFIIHVFDLEVKERDIDHNQ